jgi:hypothetical protein
MSDNYIVISRCEDEARIEMLTSELRPKESDEGVT